MWQVAFIVGMLVIFGLANIRKNNSYIEESWSVFEAVMYRCFSKTAWSLALSWVVFSAVMVLALGRISGINISSISSGTD